MARTSVATSTPSHVPQHPSSSATPRRPASRANLDRLLLLLLSSLGRTTRAAWRHPPAPTAIRQTMQSTHQTPAGGRRPGARGHPSFPHWCSKRPSQRSSCEFIPPRRRRRSLTTQHARSLIRLIAIERATDDGQTSAKPRPEGQGGAWTAQDGSKGGALGIFARTCRPHPGARRGDSSNRRRARAARGL